MNIAEKMALECATKISEPFLDKAFFPVKNDNYIIFDTRCKYPYGSYDFYEEVLDLVKEYLSSAGIGIIQFADDDNYKLNSDACYIKLNAKQEAYLIEKSMLIVANENYSLYMAAVLDKKSIGLYSVYNPKNTAPVWNKDSQIIIESDREGNNPTYNQLAESPKTVNKINPYIVAVNILNNLNIDHDLDKYELVHLGDKYNQKIVEIVPDFISSSEFLSGNSINLRLDLVKELNGQTFYYWMQNKKVNLLTDKDLNLKLIRTFRQNIIALTILMSDNISENFLKACKSIGLKVKIYCSDRDKIKDYRFKFLDWDIEKDYNDNIKLDSFSNINKNSTYKSSKVIISKGKKYASKAAYLDDSPLDKSGNSVILNKEFEEELDYFKIYNEKSSAEKR